MLDFLLAFIGSFCPAVLFNIEKKNLIWAGLCGALGWLAYERLLQLTANNILSVLCASVTISLYGELMARFLKTPSTVFFIPGLFPLVPGLSAYYTVLYLTEKKLELAMVKALETMGIAGAIALGIMLVSTVFKFINMRAAKQKKKNTTGKESMDMNM